MVVDGDEKAVVKLEAARKLLHHLPRAVQQLSEDR